MQKLPPPTTFAEGMRLLFAIAALVAGIAFGIGLVVLVSVLVWGAWPAALYPKILNILGYVAIGALTLIGITQVGILLGGPVGRFKAAVGRDGAVVEGDSTSSSTIAAVAQGAAAGAAAGAVSATTTATTAQEKTP